MTAQWIEALATKLSSDSGSEQWEERTDLQTYAVHKHKHPSK